MSTSEVLNPEDRSF